MTTHVWFNQYFVCIYNSASFLHNRLFYEDFSIVTIDSPIGDLKTDYPTDNKAKEYPVLPIAAENIIDTNGAGDAFVGGTFFSTYIFCALSCVHFWCIFVQCDTIDLNFLV